MATWTLFAPVTGCCFFPFWSVSFVLFLLLLLLFVFVVVSICVPSKFSVNASPYTFDAGTDELPSETVSDPAELAAIVFWFMLMARSACEALYTGVKPVRLL